MGFLPVSQRFYISVSALSEQEINARSAKRAVGILYQCILIELVTLLMTPLNTVENVQGAQTLSKYLGLFILCYLCTY